MADQEGTELTRDRVISIGNKIMSKYNLARHEVFSVIRLVASSEKVTTVEQMLDVLKKEYNLEP